MVIGRTLDRIIFGMLFRNPVYSTPEERREIVTRKADAVNAVFIYKQCIEDGLHEDFPGILDRLYDNIDDADHVGTDMLIGNCFDTGNRAHLKYLIGRPR